MRFLKKAGIVFDRFNDILVWLAALLLTFVWISVSVEVFLRYFLNRPMRWTFESTENILVWITFLGAAWLLRSEGHIKIDLVVARLKPRGQFVINIIISILCAIACLVIAWYGVRVVSDQFQRNLHFVTLLAPLMWPLYTIIPISGFLLFIQFLRRTYRYLADWRVLQASSEVSTAKL